MAFTIISATHLAVLAENSGICNKSGDLHGNIGTALRSDRVGLCSWNLTSAAGKADYLRSYSCQQIICSLQEEKLTRDGQLAFDRSLIPCSVKHGPSGQPAGLGRYEGAGLNGSYRHAFNAADSAGVCVVAPPEFPIVDSVETDGTVDGLVESRRWIEAFIDCGRIDDDQTGFVVGSTYFVDTSMVGQEKLNADLARDCNSAAKRWPGHMPYFLTGDFQGDPCRFQSFSTDEGWYNLAEVLGGPDAGLPTFCSDRNWNKYDRISGATCIDAILCNAAGLALAAALRYERGFPYGGHIGVYAELRLDRLEHTATYFTPPRAFPVFDVNINDDIDVHNIFFDAFRPWRKEFYEAYNDEKVERTWTIANRVNEDFLVLLCGLEHDEDVDKYRGRGEVPVFEEKQVCARNTRAKVLDVLDGLISRAHAIRADVVAHGPFPAPPQREQLHARVSKVNRILGEYHRHQNCSILSRFWLRSNWAVPSLDEVDQFLRSLCQASRKHSTRISQGRIDAHKRNVKGSLCAGLSAACKWTSAPLRSPEAGPLVDEEGHVATAPQDLHEMLAESWRPIFQQEEVDENAFFDEYDDDIYRGPIFHLDEVDPVGVHGRIQRMRTNRSAGLDGWRTRELQRLPIAGIALFCKVYDLVERVGVWPECLCHLGFSFVRKAGGLGPRDGRWIGVSSGTYAGWSGRRYDQIEPWRRRWRLHCQTGARASVSTEAVSVFHQLSAEAAKYMGFDLYLLLLDREKFFDGFRYNLLWRMYREAGYPPRLLRARMAWYKQMVMFYKFRGTYSCASYRWNGSVQGCIFSIDDCGLFMRTYGSRVGRIASIQQKLHFDDTSARTSEVGDLCECVNQTELFDTLAGQRCSKSKSVLLVGDDGCLDDAMGITLHGQVLACRKSGRLVGATMQLDFNDEGDPTADARLDKAIRLCERASCIRGTPVQKSRLHRTQIMSVASYTPELASPNPAKVVALRNLTKKCILNQGHQAWRPLKLVLSFIPAGYSNDYSAMQGLSLLTHVRDQIWQCSYNLSSLRTIWQPIVDGGPGLTHLVGRFRDLGHSLGWTWHPGLRGTTDIGWDFSLFNVSRRWLRYLFVDSWRRTCTRSVSPDRPDLAGLCTAPSGVDWVAAHALYNTGFPDQDHLSVAEELNVPKPVLQWALHTAVTGGIPSQDRTVASGLSADPSRLCRFCGVEVESVYHLCMRCPRFECLRTQCRETVLKGKFDADFRPCELLAGLPLQDPCLLGAFRDQVINLDDKPTAGLDVVEPNDLNRGVTFECIDGIEHAIGGLDGSCFDNKHMLIARAGSSCYWGLQHPRNQSAPLQGGFQSSPRAEVFGVILGLRSHWTHSLFVIDNLGVCEKLNVLIHADEKPADFHRWDHADLWAEVWTLLEATVYSVKAAWCPGHSKMADVEAGRVPLAYHLANHGADDLAKKGSAEHAIDEQLRDAAWKRVAETKALQAMLSWVLAVRFLSLPLLGRETGYTLREVRIRRQWLEHLGGSSRPLARAIRGCAAGADGTFSHLATHIGVAAGDDNSDEFGCDECDAPDFGAVGHLAARRKQRNRASAAPAKPAADADTARLGECLDGLEALLSRLEGIVDRHIAGL